MQIDLSQDGEHIERHINGSIAARGQIKDGQLDGYWEWYRANGTKKRSGTFAMGKQVGEWITYDDTGEIHKKTFFSSDHL